MTEQDKKIRDEFPLLKNKDIVYLDNSATSQKPQCVLDAVMAYYENYNANPLRGLYELSVEATDAYENARSEVADFIGAREKEEIVFTRNATESLNLVAYSYGMHFLKAQDEILISIEEHHSNILPWQQVAKKTGAKLVYFECEQDGTLDIQKFEKQISSKTKIVAMTQISNVFGRKNDIRAFAEIAHQNGAVFVCDGAQSVPHIPVDVKDLNVDFMAFSGHKMFAAMGIGVLYAKRELLEQMPPFLLGGEMIEYVTREDATYAEVPHKFEAGTVNAGGAVSLGAAIRFMKKYGWDAIENRENELTKMAVEGIQKIPHVTLLGAEDYKEHHGILTFKIEGVHPHDIAAIFDEAHVAVRAGHHCAQPLHKYLGVMSTTRASLAFYNTKEDVQAFLDCLKTIRGKMGYTD